LNYETDYQYDTLGNLLRVDQKGSAPSDSTQWRTRTFTYDSLSRMLTATNPESGLVTYYYDANGNVLQKVMPTPNQTGTAQHTISYCYDQLNRVTGKAYSWQNCQGTQLPTGTAVVSYTYDQGRNGIGFVTSLTDQAGSASYTYDMLGRLISQTRTTNSVTKTIGITHNLDGSLLSLTYPSGATVNYTPDVAGRPVSANDGGNSINYVTGATYGPNGGLAGFVTGNNTSFAGITNTVVYNQRLQTCRIAASSTGAVPTNCVNSWGNLLDFQYDFHAGSGDNGNIFGITNWRDQTRNQSFTYDVLNRLASAQNAGTDCTKKTLNPNQTEYWGNTYGYDAWGNLQSKTVTNCSSESLSVTALTNNQLSGYSYDAAGNMTHDSSSNLNYTYDMENRLSSVAGYTYTYDADGNRVEKSNGTTGTLYWYLTPGVVAESDLAGNLQAEYVFSNGQRVARKDFPANTVSYYLSNHLGTSSVIADASGNLKAESDFYPWGGELQLTNNDPNHYKFTGDEHDSESSLEHTMFRHLSAAQGRWITPDPYLGSMDFTNPQSMNRYSYVANDPANSIDPLGLDMQKTYMDANGCLVTITYHLNEGGGYTVTGLDTFCSSVGNGNPSGNTSTGGGTSAGQPCQKPSPTPSSRYWTSWGDPNNPAWNRLKMLGTGLGNIGVAGAKIGAAAAVEVGSTGVGTPLAIIGVWSGSGNLTAGLLQIVGSAMPDPTAFQQGANVASAATSFSGLGTLMAGGSVDQAANSAKWEGMLLSGFKWGATGNAPNLPSSYSLVNNAANLAAGSSSGGCK
jgi:RHS repeat-associated protein